MEYSAKAYLYSQEAHRESASSFGETGTTLPEPVKRANGAAKGSKKKR
jgi:hypothetical protein